MSEKDDFDVEKLLADLFKKSAPEKRLTLKELFDQRVHELGISTTKATQLLELQSRTLKGMLEGTQKSISHVALHRLANFLQLSDEVVNQLYFEAFKQNYAEELSTAVSSTKVQFIRENFDLAALKKAGFIRSLTDYNEIENRITSFFGLRRIEDYQLPDNAVAFSAGRIQADNSLIRSTWIGAAKKVFEVIDNPNVYHKEALVEYFPQIRWHTRNVKQGMIDVIRHLYKLGVTVIYQPPLPSLHLRGATFSVNEKPCIVLTDYRGFYTTLWFALIHELFHVIFDWEEIKLNVYHLSDDDVGQLTVKEREDEADDFARKYLLPKEKSELITPFLRDAEYVRQFAEEHHIHESFIYVFHAFDNGKSDRGAWPLAKRNNPQFTHLIERLGNSWDNPKPIVSFVKELEISLYKGTT